MWAFFFDLKVHCTLYYIFCPHAISSSSSGEFSTLNCPNNEWNVRVKCLILNPPGPKFKVGRVNNAQIFHKSNTQGGICKGALSTQQCEHITMTKHQQICTLTNEHKSKHQMHETRLHITHYQIAYILCINISLKSQICKLHRLMIVNYTGLRL